MNIIIYESQYWRVIRNNEGRLLRREKKKWAETAKNGRIENNQLIYDIYENDEFKRTKKFYLKRL